MTLLAKQQGLQMGGLSVTKGSSLEGKRNLIYVGIVHSKEDMGRLGRHLPAVQGHQRFAQMWWRETERQVRDLRLDWPKVKVFQDGLPDAAQEVIERILAEVHSPNYGLLRWLVAQGAELVGTESPAMLREEYDHLQAVLNSKNAAMRAEALRIYSERAPALLAERDAYIGQRIAAMLPDGATGVLFIGLAHNVEEYLPPDVVVHRLNS